MKLLENTKIKDLELKNRIVMEPMCMYSAFKHDGVPTHFHFAHYVSRAISQVGLIIVEATGVLPEGRITDECLGLWNDTQMEAFKPIVDAVHQEGGKIGIQLNHAGRKCTAIDGVDTIYGPSALAYSDDYREPLALDDAGIQNVFNAFKEAARRANEAGFDLIEIHGAHGYLVSEFMSPISNVREDQYKDASLFIKGIVEAVRETWPIEKPLGIRVSTTDYEEHGLDIDKTTEILKPIAHLFDVINVSTGGITPRPPHSIYPGYQVDHATHLKNALNKPVMACGLLGDLGLASFLVESDKTDFIGLARPLLNDPHWVLHAAHSRRKVDVIPQQYKRAFK